jgi:hypothetical protein
MGLVKQWMMEQHEEDIRQELREWFWDRHGRWPKPSELDGASQDKEIEDAFEHAMSKDD